MSHTEPENDEPQQHPAEETGAVVDAAAAVQRVGDGVTTGRVVVVPDATEATA